MKHQISITVDTDTWIIAKDKVPNLSKYLNDCLISIAGKSPDDRSKEQLMAELNNCKNIIEEMSVKKSLAIQALRSIEETKAAESKKQEELERLKRWSCGVCHTLNFMDQDRCSKCNLPTRKDSRSKEVMLETGTP